MISLGISLIRKEMTGGAADSDAVLQRNDKSTGD